MGIKFSNPEAFSFPVDPIPGAIVMVFRKCRLREVVCWIFTKSVTVLAFLADNAEVSYSLDETVKRPSSVSIDIQQEVVTLFNHRGGKIVMR
jgi:hypothetical protein